MDIRKDAGAYAWKPLAIANSLGRSARLIVWLDAGDLLTGHLKSLRKFVLSLGFYSPYSSGNIGDWTHPGTLSFLGVSPQILGGPNCNGAVIAFDLKNVAAKTLLQTWARHALEVDCIAPKGANLQNHRFDQAVLSVLAEKMLLNQPGLFRHALSPLNILIHQDDD
jgi:hypothetical protein